MKRAFLLMTLVLLCAGLALAREAYTRWQTPLTLSPDGYALTIKPGESLRSVVGRLHEAGVVRYPWLLRAYGRYTGLASQVKRGEYLLQAPLDAPQLLQLLARGAVVQYQLTLPEGISLREAMAILRAHDKLESELSGVDDERLLGLVAPNTVGEGLFFPDSYAFESGYSDWQLLSRAHRQMMQVLEAEWAERDEGLPYETPYEALIMASIVEKETGVGHERAQIAGVFVRRLNMGMRLQTDPTVIYGLGEEYSGNLRRKHLQDRTNPYNTYRHKGLPPSPIALPGRAAIHAALHPQAGETLYFVARGDGSHVFSKTLKEHEKAVKEYQLNRRKDYRSSPERR